VANLCLLMWTILEVAPQSVDTRKRPFFALSSLFSSSLVSDPVISSDKPVSFHTDFFSIPTGIRSSIFSFLQNLILFSVCLPVYIPVRQPIISSLRMTLLQKILNCMFYIHSFIAFNFSLVVWRLWLTPGILFGFSLHSVFLYSSNSLFV
jgi:hypothetical protein